MHTFRFSSNAAHTLSSSFESYFRGSSLLTLALVLIVSLVAVTSAQAATLRTDSLEYQDGSTVSIEGSYFYAGETVHIAITYADGSSLPVEMQAEWDVVADGTGSVSSGGTSSSLGLPGDDFDGFLSSWMMAPEIGVGDTLKVTAIGDASGYTATALFCKTKTLMHQLQNGVGAVDPQWHNGNINKTNSCYSEGNSVPYRFFAKDQDAGTSHYITITFKATKSTEHAFDYLTAYDLSEADILAIYTACSDSAAAPPDDCSTPLSVASFKDPRLLSSYTAAPPADVSAIIDPTFPLNGLGSLYGYNVSGVSVGQYYYTGASGSRTLNVDVNFTVIADGSVGFFWGGHLSVGHPDGWGIGFGSASVSGAPYHMSAGLDGGSQPNSSVSNGGLCLPPDVSITCGAGPYCTGSVQTCSVPTGGDDYDWTVTGGTIISGQGTASITYSVTALQSETITVTVNACNTATTCPGEYCCSEASVSMTADNCCSVTITCPADVTIECDESIDPANTGTATFTSSGCSAITLAYSDSEVAGICSQEKVITRTWQALDASQTVRAECTQTITVEDTVAPILADCPADVTVECDAIPAAAAVTATDNCAVAPSVTLVETEAAGACANEKTITRTWTAVDGCGNQSSCTQTIIVVDTTPPVLVGCPTDVTVQCDAIPAAATVTATDNCDVVPPTVTLVESEVAGACANEKVITRTWSAADACGNPISCTQIITVIDDTPPQMTCPVPVTVACPADVPAPNVALVTATDNCDPNPTITFFSDVSDGLSCPETITRKYKAIDACGNIAFCTQTITIDDQVPPVITCPPNLTVFCDESLDPSFTGSASATDNCTATGNIAITYDDFANNGTISRTWTATDECGNVANCTQTITVGGDVTPPQITCPDPVSVTCLTDVPAADPLTVTVFDNCDLAPVVIHVSDVTSGTACPITITRTYRATDISGNFVECVQIITIDDQTPPSITCPAPVTVDCFANLPTPNPALVSASDNCTANPAITFVSDVSDGLSCPETITRTYRAVDDCGNEAFCTQTLIIDDLTPPSITCPPMVTVECSADIPVADIGSVTVSDNCDPNPSVVFVSDVSDGNTCPEMITRTYQVTDVCGNSASCTQIIKVSDDTPPQITCPLPVTVACPADVPAPNVALVTATDNCDPNPTITFFSDLSDGLSCPETITRKYKAIDACGNIAFCTQTITIDDQVPPVITCPPNLTVFCDESLDPSFTGSATATDNCTATGNIVITYDDFANNGTISRTWTATDECGNVANCTQTITIGGDVSPPQITCPDAVTVTCLTAVPPADPLTVTAIDNCDLAPVVIHVSDVTSGATCPITITRTYRATDASGNFVECTQIITIDDQEAPVLANCPSNLTLECDDPVPVPDNVTVTDNCGATLTFVENEVPGNCPGERVITRTWTATDVCGNSDQCVQTITFADQTPPQITCPDPITVACAADVPAANIGLVTASDNCDPNPTVLVWGDVSDGLTCPETITRTYKAIDCAGNMAFCTQSITVHDLEAPVLVGCPIDLTLECDDPIPAPANVTVTDNCGAAIVFEEDEVPGNCPGEKVITRTWTATDDCGNTDVCVQIITVRDTTPPPISCPGPIAVECRADIPTPNPGLIQVIDNCDPNATAMFVSDVSDGLSCPETITRTYKVIDCAGNMATCTQIITVDDITAPTIIDCPGAIQVACPTDVPAADVLLVTATDNCTASPTVTHISDVSDGQTCPETITRTYRVADDCDNEVFCTQTITIDDQLPPVITCPDHLTVDCQANVPVPDPASVTATDNCTTNPVVTHVGDVLDPAANPPTVTRTYSAIDDCGNVATCAQVITIEDNTPPNITCPDPVTVDCVADIPVPDISLVTATDDCGGDPVVEWVSDDVAGTCPTVVTRTYKATDASGNIAFCTQILTADDNIPPIITDCPGPVTVECVENIPQPDIALVTATDNCGPIDFIEFVADVSDGLSCPETITRTYRAVDFCDNEALCQQTITVHDQTEPVCNVPDDINETQCAPTEICRDVSVSDGCDLNPTMTILSGPGTIADGQWCYMPTGSANFEVTIRCEDACGNFCDVSFQVSLEVNTPPEITNCPDTDQQLAWGDVFIRDMLVTDPDVGQGLTFSLCEGAPQGATIDPQTGHFEWPSTGRDVCDPNICIIVTDDCQIADTCSFYICVFNEAPVISCPDDQTVCNGEEFQTFVSATDPDSGPWGPYFYLVSGPQGVEVDVNTGAVTWAQPVPGDWQICVTATDSAAVCDPCSPANADSCCFNLKVVALDLVIQKVHRQIQGQYTEVSIDFMHDLYNWPIAGYDLLIQYDASALDFVSAREGEFFTDCAWEYFTYRFGASGNCGFGACPSGVLRIVALAESQGGNVANHPDCYTNDGLALPGPGSSTSSQLAVMKFLVSNDRTLECQYVPIRFVWYDCGDNGLSDVSGDTLFISNQVFDYAGELGEPPVAQWNNVTGMDNLFPSLTGAVSPDCDISDKYELVRCANFYNGGIDIICADSIDAPGDINLNGISYEIADAVMFTNYFVSGLNAFTGHVDGSIAASDVNKDGITLSVADLVYAIRVVVGDAMPYAKPEPSRIAQANYWHHDGVIGVSTATPMGGAALVLKGDAHPELLVDGMKMTYRYDGENTRVIITPDLSTGSASFRGEFLAGVATEIIAIELATAEGQAVSAKNVPVDYRLSQNYPNPFNPATVIEFALPLAGNFELTIYNIQGQLVESFSGVAEAPGVFKHEWDASGHASGVYLYRLDAGTFTQTRKMLLLK